MNEQELYRQFKEGNQSAMVALVERYYQPIFDFLYRFTNDALLADDLSQEVFIRLMNYPKSPDNIRAWLYRVARNIATDFFRSAYHRREESTTFERESFSSPNPTPEQQMMRQEQLSQVATALQGLPIEQRDVVILRFYHDLSLAEIAEVTDAPLGTVKSRLFHGLKKLKTIMTNTEGMLP